MVAILIVILLDIMVTPYIIVKVIYFSYLSTYHTIFLNIFLIIIINFPKFDINICFFFSNLNHYNNLCLDESKQNTNII